MSSTTAFAQRRRGIRLSSACPHSDYPGRLDFHFLTSANSKPQPKAQPRQQTSELMREAEIRDLERRNLIAILKHTKWKISGADGAAEFLGVHPATLASRIRSLKITRSQSEHIKKS
ncbi:MAG: hypothetical protein EXS05_13620 [Planctomycetaceae bacterium]|nr:hypothetical protein [Planctomycetaceae bacterium]